MIATLLLAAAVQGAPTAPTEADRDIACAAFAAWLEDYRQRFEHAGPSLVLVREPNLISGTSGLIDDEFEPGSADDPGPFFERLAPLDQVRLHQYMEPTVARIFSDHESDWDIATQLVREAGERAIRELGLRLPQEIFLVRDDWQSEGGNSRTDLQPFCSNDELGGRDRVALIQAPSEAQMSREEYEAWGGAGYSELSSANRRSQSGDEQGNTPDADPWTYWGEVYSLQAVRLDNNRRQVLLDVDISTHGVFRYWMRRSDEGDWFLYADHDLIWY